MGKCSRNRGKQREERDAKQGRGPKAQPWVNPLSQPKPFREVLKDFKLSDLFTATPQGGQSQGQGQAPKPEPEPKPEPKPEPQPKPEPEPGTAGPNGTYQPGYGNSRWNSWKSGLRAKILFSTPMQALIDERYRDFAAENRARSLLDFWLCLELARSSVKIDLANDLLAIDQERVLDRVENHWDEDAAARADQRAKKLPDEPYDIARELGRCKFGALLLISRWEALGDAVAVNHRLDEAQIQMAYDLLAIPKVLRNGSRQVPAADDAPALWALIAREVGRHKANIERSLNASDRSDRENARFTIMKQRDSITRGLRADLHRAEKRSKWAMDVLLRLRQGVDPATIIDPDTKQPIKPDAPTAPASEPEPAAAPAAAAETAPPTDPPPPEAQPQAPQQPLPKGCSEDDEELLRIVSETIGEYWRQNGAAGPIPPG